MPSRAGRKPTQLGWWVKLARVHRWSVLALGGAGTAALVTGVVLASPPSTTDTLMRNCGLVICHAVLPPAATDGAAPPPAAPPGTMAQPRLPGQRMQHRQQHAAAGRQAPQALPSAAPAAASTPPPAASTAPAIPVVTVSYSVVQQWDGGFQGEFTIVNHGAAAISGWQLAAVFPGDTIESAWDASFHTGGDTLLLDPPSYQLTIAPGAGLAEHFTAAGTTTTPESCTFNGAAC